MWNFVLQRTLPAELKSIEVKVSTNWAVCRLEWLKPASVKKLHKKLLLYTVWGTWTLFSIFLTFRTVRPAKGKSKKCIFASGIWKTNCLFSSWESIAKTFNQINIILVTVVPLKLVKIQLKDLKDSFPWCVIPYNFKATCSVLSVCRTDLF